MYESMSLRGFKGEYNTGVKLKINAGDMLYLLVWGLFFAACRFVNVPEVLGRLFMGVI